MKVTRISDLTGVVRTRELPITESQVLLYNTGKYNIQEIFPELSADDREFIMTGITQEEWDEAFKDPDDEQ